MKRKPAQPAGGDGRRGAGSQRAAHRSPIAVKRKPASLRWVVAMLLLAILVVIFAVQNSASVTVTVAGISAQSLPLSAVCLASCALGLGFGWGLHARHRRGSR